jgi:predicted RNA binding protein YcfA (HicA-like mRNA interferase family)
MGASKMKRLLRKLGYKEVSKSGSGSHCWLEAPGRPRIRWAFHDRRELGAMEVRKVLVEQAGLTLEEAREVVRRA